MAKPTDLPVWDTNQSNTTQPDPTRQADGWVFDGGKPQKPLMQYVNWLYNIYYLWLSYFSNREKTLPHDFASDADYTLTAAENEYGRYVIADTGVVLTTTRKIIFDTEQRAITVQNDTLQTITAEVLGGTGVNVPSGESYDLYNDGTDMIEQSTNLVFASASENAAGTVEGKAVDPLGIREAFNATGSAPVFACRAWGHFDGTVASPVFDADGNFTSITKNGTGDYTLTFTTAMPDALYAVEVSGKPTNDSTIATQSITYYGKSTTTVSIRTNTNAGVASDWEYISIMVMR